MARRSKLGQWTSSASAKSEVLSPAVSRSEEHTSELQSPCNLVCRLLLEKKKTPEHGNKSRIRHAHRAPNPHNKDGSITDDIRHAVGHRSTIRQNYIRDTDSTYKRNQTPA